MVVDELLPCSPGTTEPLFSRSAQEGELWPALIEKAYAKLHGSYYALEGGNTAEALVDLTGGASMKIKLTHPKVGPARAASSCCSCRVRSRGVCYGRRMCACECMLVVVAGSVSFGAGSSPHHGHPSNPKVAVAHPSRPRASMPVHVPAK